MIIPGVIASGYQQPTGGSGVTGIDLPNFVAGENMIFDIFDSGTFLYQRATRGASTPSSVSAKTDGAVSSGKWYIEVDTTFLDNLQGEVGVGIDTSIDLTTALYTQSNVWSVSSARAGVYSGGVDASNAAGVLTPIEGARMMIALDLDNKKVWFGRDGVWNSSVDAPGGTVADADGLAAGSYVVCISLEKRDTYMLIPELSDACLYAAPDGFTHWSRV